MLLKMTTGAWAQPIVLKSKRESILNRLLLNLYRSLGSTDRFEIKTRVYTQPCIKSLREPVLNHAPMVDFFQNCMIMLINHQPLEAYTCLLYPNEHGSLGIDLAVEGPVSASPFPVNMVELTCVSITII